MIYVLDACALIAVFNIEAGAEKVRRLLLNATAREDGTVVYINPVNLLEVYYDRLKIVGYGRAEEILRWIYASAIQIHETITPSILREAGRLKTAYSMSLADSFACATASCLNATLVTSDHKELEAVERGESIHFFWFR
jgi:predicted nucleic acid-binding protein